MDNTKEFILQCEKAIEIQKLWKNKISEESGGTFSNGNMIDTSNGYWVMVRVFWNESDFVAYKGSKENYFWLPRQDQLQEMLRSKYDIRTMCWDFNGFIGGRRAGYSMQFTSMEQLWLAFVMQVKFGKVWNGKGWVQWVQKITR